MPNCTALEGRLNEAMSRSLSSFFFLNSSSAFFLRLAAAYSCCFCELSISLAFLSISSRCTRSCLRYSACSAWRFFCSSFYCASIFCFSLAEGPPATCLRTLVFGDGLGVLSAEAPGVTFCSSSYSAMIEDFMVSPKPPVLGFGGSPCSLRFLLVDALRDLLS